MFSLSFRLELFPNIWMPLDMIDIFLIIESDEGVE